MVTPCHQQFFGLFINDLATDVNTSGKGIKLREQLIVALLLYADIDDLAIFAESEVDLQEMLNILVRLCTKLRMIVNVKKNKKTSQQKTEYNFIFNNEVVECVDK